LFIAWRLTNRREVSPDERSEHRDWRLDVRCWRLTDHREVSPDERSDIGIRG